MRFQMIHQYFNVKDLETSLKFYREAPGLTECRRIEKESFTIENFIEDPDGYWLEIIPER